MPAAPSVCICAVCLDASVGLSAPRGTLSLCCVLGCQRWALRPAGTILAMCVPIVLLLSVLLYKTVLRGGKEKAFGPPPFPTKSNQRSNRERVQKKKGVV